MFPGDVTADASKQHQNEKEEFKTIVDALKELLSAENEDERKRARMFL
jgi:hypothetical protein